MALESLSGNAPRPGADRAGEAERLMELVGSRICHDLANPVGAIANGVELLQMAGPGAGEAELELVADSVGHAAARLKFLRIAFGAATPGQSLGSGEAALILDGVYGGGRLSVGWDIEVECPRAEVKLAFLLLQCIEAALPRGGAVLVRVSGSAWRIVARGEKVKDLPALWAVLAGGPLPDELRGAEVQFALAPRTAAALERRIVVEVGPDTVSFGF